MGVLLRGSGVVLAGGRIVRSVAEVEPPADVAVTDIVFSASTVAYDAAEDDVLCTLSAPGATLPVTYSIVGGDDAALVYVDGAQIKRSGSGSMTPDDALDIDVQADNAAGSPYVETWSPTVIDPEAAVEVWQVGLRDDTASARTNVPFLFRIPLPTGGRSVTETPILSSGNTIIADIGGTPQSVQVSNRTVAQGGELTGVTVAGVLSSLGSGATSTVKLSAQSGSDPTGTAITWADVLATDWNRYAEWVVGGTTYTADPRTTTTGHTAYSAASPHYRGTFMEGPHCTCFVFSVPFDDGSGNRPSDFLRAHYHVYAFKAGAGAVGPSNKIKILADIVLGNEAFDPPAWGDLTCDTLRIRDEDGNILDSWSSVTAYAFAASDMDREYWWAPDGESVGGCTAIHETDSLGLTKFMSYGWHLPQSVPSSAVSGQIATWNGVAALNTDKPFARQGAHEYAQGTTGSRPDIAIFQKVEQYSLFCWNDDARSATRKNVSAGISIPWRVRDQNTGLMLNPTSSRSTALWRDDATGTQTDPSPRTTPYSLEPGAHQPIDGYLLWNLMGRLKYLECIQMGCAFSWVREPIGTGLTRNIVSHGQVRGQAWVLRTVGLTLASTPNDMPATITGWTRAYCQTWLDNTMGTAGGAIEFGRYLGAKNQYWGTDGGSGMPLSGAYDNDDPTDGRYFWHSGGLASCWMSPFWVAATAMLDRLNVFDPNGLAMADWVYEVLPRMVESRQGMIFPDLYEHVKMSSLGGLGPKTWDQRCFDNNVDALPTASRMYAAAMRPAPTSFTVDATNPAAVVITMNGTGLMPWFDDNEESVGGTRGDWFKGTGRWNMRGTGGQWVWWIGKTGRGRIVAVSPDGLSCTVDTTVTNGVAMTSETVTGVSLSKTLMLPWIGPASTWGDSTSYIVDSTNDYTVTWAGGMGVCKIMTPGRANIGTYEAAAKARALARTQGSGVIHDPPQSGDGGVWFWFGGG